MSFFDTDALRNDFFLWPDPPSSVVADSSIGDRALPAPLNASGGAADIVCDDDAVLLVSLPSTPRAQTPEPRGGRADP